MKKLLAIILVVWSITSCKVPVYTIGMTETEFKAHNKFADLFEATEQTTIYKNPYDTDNEGKVLYKYFYFSEGKLVRIDEGEYKRM